MTQQQTIEERLAVVESEMRNIKDEVRQNRDERREADKAIFAELRILTAAMHRGKGALAALLAAAGIFGGAVGVAAKALFGSPPN